MSISKKKVPVTPLRDLYIEMASRSQAQGDLDLAKEMTPDLLAKKFLESVRVFESYENVEARFVGDARAKKDDITKYLGYVKRTINLAALLQARGTQRCFVHERPEKGGSRCESLDFSYVDREIVPARTSDGEFIGGSVSQAEKTTKNRSADLLLKSVDGRPIIGEVKIDGDKNPYFALTQLLMHAAEMVTENQVRRLQEQYDDVFDIADRTAPQYDLYLILVRYDEHLSKGNQGLWLDLLKITKALAVEFCRNKEVSKYIRRIICLNLSNEWTVGEGIQLQFKAGE